jgi:hypothetical protein
MSTLNSIDSANKLITTNRLEVHPKCPHVNCGREKKVKNCGIFFTTNNFIAEPRFRKLRITIANMEHYNLHYRTIENVNVAIIDGSTQIQSKVSRSSPPLIQ